MLLSTVQAHRLAAVYSSIFSQPTPASQTSFPSQCNAPRSPIVMLREALLSVCSTVTLTLVPINLTTTIGEYVPQYAGVADTPAIPTWPVSSPTRWTVLLESFIVNGTNVPVSTTVDGAPSNLAVVLLDSGTSYTYVSTLCCVVLKPILYQLCARGRMRCYLPRSTRGSVRSKPGSMDSALRLRN
jgi:hypothetical protein